MPTTGGATTEGLNERQREAVTHAGPPLIVLAGPGTGKTRVIVHRVAHLIETGVRPESIVALTYTVKAANELRERLLELVGQSAADRVNAHTFHGFGYRLICRFPDFLGIPSPGQPRLLDSALTRRLIRSLIREHDLFPELIPTGRDRVIDECVETIDALACNAVSPADASAFAGRWHDRLTSNEDGLDAAALDAQAQRQNRFAQIAGVYGLFADACRAGGWTTFDDLILWPIRLLRDVAPAASIIRDDYRHFVVDEFQDANLSQIELLRQLCPARRGEGPDLCVVGDDDQAIYEFRGADDRAFARFKDIWPTSRVIALEENYRAEAKLIEVSNAVIAGAETRFAPDKSLRPCNATAAREPLAGAAVECVTVESDLAAGGPLASVILADRAANPGRAFSSYAVIARTHTDLERIGAALRLEGIPTRLARGPSALADAGVKDLLRWIEFLVLPTSEAASANAVHWLLSRPPFSIPLGTLIEWLQAWQAECSRERLGERTDGGTERRRPTTAFSAWLLDRHGVDAEHGPALGRFATLADDLRQATAHAPAPDAVFEIIRRADLAHTELLDGRARAARVSLLAGIVRFVRARRDGLEPPGDLASFWNYYNDLDDDERQFRDRGEDRVDGAGDPDPADLPDAVTLLTAHSAKGLEFDTVFVPRVRGPYGYPKTSGESRAELPAGLVDRAGDDRPAKDRVLAEERRLFYVACTRARRRLVLLAKRRKSRTSGTDFFNEVSLDAPGNALVIRRSSADLLADAARLGVKCSARTELDDAADPEAPAGRDEILRRARQDVRLAAAQALDTTDRPDATETDIAEASNVLRECAERMAVVAHFAERSEPPRWAVTQAAPPAVRAFAARLGDTLASARSTRPFAAELFKPLKAPLALSYSRIDGYTRCPRCFYLKHILRIPEPSSPELLIGTVVHESLAGFYTLRRAAEAEGRPGPTLDRLLSLARERFTASLAPEAVADPELLGRVLSQLTTTHQRLDNPRDEIEQIEFPIRLAWDRNGHSHEIKGKIDRLDRLPPPARGHRIVDYKTGQPRQPLTKPEATDLQLGIYAMALQKHQQGDAGLLLWDNAGDGHGHAEGIAEYWVLSTGERGSINLGSLDYESITGTINEAVDGMLAGRFESADRCSGLCSTFARD